MSDLTPDTVFPRRKVKQFFILATILTIGLILFGQLMFMLSAFLGAVTLYIILRRPHKYLMRRYRWKSLPASIFLMLFSFIILSVPFYLIIQFMVAKISPLVSSPEPLIDGINTINAYIASQFDFTLLSPDNMSKVNELASKVLSAIIGSGASIITNLILLYFLLWFMLNNSFKMERWLQANSPFSRANTRLILNETKNTVINNSIGIVVLGLMQGIIAIIGYSLFGIDEPVLWGLITAAASVIPFAGTMIIWIPMSILLFAQGHTMDGLGLSLWGLILIGGIDNVLRFILQKRIAQTHPLITVLGVIVGLNLFGFWGLIFGPLMFSLFLLLNRIYKNEYTMPLHEKGNTKIPPL